MLFYYHRKKLDNRATLSIFLEFKPHNKGYIYLNNKNHKIEVYKHVIFYENHFPYHSTFEHSKDPNSFSLPVPEHYAQTYNDLNMHNENKMPYVMKMLLLILFLKGQPTTEDLLLISKTLRPAL